MFSIQKITITLLISFCIVNAFDRDHYKVCQQSSFCRRCRKVVPDNSPFVLIKSNLSLGESSLRAELRHKRTDVRFTLMFEALRNSTFRLRIDEKTPLRDRYKVSKALKDGPVSEGKLRLLERTSFQIVIANGENKAVVSFEPFRVDFYADEQVVISTNARGLMRFEHLRTKNSSNSHDGAEDDPDAWEEDFRGFLDTKPFGPEAVALDFDFPEASNVYGLPEHADFLALNDTSGGEPFRLYNLDVYKHDVYTRMALYGSVPVLYAHGMNSTAGIFWHNAAETWIDILSSSNNKSDFTNEGNIINAHFMSESGIIDVFFLLGPQPIDVFKQYTILTGTANLPPMFSLGYHQSRYNYMTQNEVLQVAHDFDQHDMPMDVIWLDIEYTDGKRYFTWHPQNFPDPSKMVTDLVTQGRKLVIIIDPYVKRDPNYFLHIDATKSGIYVKNKEGEDYEGFNFPGASSYLDFFNPISWEYYANLHHFNKFNGTSSDVHIWNDQNEPFNSRGPELSIPKDLIHYHGWEHRDLHNLYGLAHHSATYHGMIDRTSGKLRPFLLTRSFFAGSQRFAAVFTGGNQATWQHLRISYPECLALAIAGLSFCGADIGGFIGNPDDELFVRWYQAGIWLPFFRQQSDMTSAKPREPWLFGDLTSKRVRNSLKLRYSYLPYWYTLFYEHEINGTPVVLPLWAHYPKEKETFSIDDHLLVGSSIMVRPVFESSVTSVSVYFPGKREVTWYDVHTRNVYRNGWERVPVTMDRIPVFQKSGSIIARKMKERPSTVAMKGDPYSFIVIFDSLKTANGSLYIDDEISFEYRRGSYLYLELKYKDMTLTSRFLHKPENFQTNSMLDSIEIIDPPRGVTTASLVSQNKRRAVEVRYSYEKNVLKLQDLQVNLNNEWILELKI